jgi:glycosyltransferase involved in cell wall biosynthesis
LANRSGFDVAFYVPWMTSLVADGAREPWPGGAETQIMLVSRALADRGLRVCLVVFDLPGAEIAKKFGGVEVIVRPQYLAGGSLVGQMREVGAIRRAIRAIDADIVVTRCAGYHVGLVGLFTKLSRRTFVYSSAGVRDFKEKIFLTKWRDRILFRLGISLADTIVVQTEEQVDLCQERFRRNPVLIRSVCEPAEQSDREPEAFLWVGRIDSNKRPLEFVELAKRVPDAPFWMVATPSPFASGAAPLWESLEHAGQTLPNFHLLPPRPRPELLDLIARSVAVVNTSEYEGMPNIFLEAWSRGVPALTLNHDPDRIIARHHLGGFADGDLERLTALAAELWESRADRAAYASRCRAYVRGEHSAQIVSRDWAKALSLDKAVPTELSVELS